MVRRTTPRAQLGIGTGSLEDLVDLAVAHEHGAVFNHVAVACEDAGVADLPG